MKNKIWQVAQYSLYLIRSFHLHGIHSPFVYELNKNLFQEKIKFYAFDEIESIRAKLLLTKKTIKVEDLGAGSQVNNAKERAIDDIAKSALKKSKKAQLLYRLVYHFKPITILELGTSLGITTSYLAKANPAAKVITIEGSKEIAKIAAVNIKKLKIGNIKQVTGNFDSVLAKELRDMKQVDFCYIDGNHKKTPTLNYFNEVLNYSTENSILIFDDIYWSKEMTAAWEEIKMHERVTVTIDLFEFGIVFLKTNQAKEHFTVYH